MPEPYYATAKELQEALEVSAEVLPDQQAVGLIETAEDLIDDRLGNRPINEETGRKVLPADEDAWRVEKLRKATLEVAKVLFEDPGVERRQRVRSVTGDVSTSGGFGSVFGERFEALLTASGLRRNTARMSGGGRRRRR